MNHHPRGDAPAVTDRRPTLVASIVKELEALSLASEDGALLGAEEALLVRFGVSRPTLRQAAKVVEAEQLIAVRRGLRGGFYAARPDAAHAIRAPARYLRLHDASLKQMYDVTMLLAPKIATLAARNRDETRRTAIRDLRETLAARPGEADSVRAIIDSEAELGALMAGMTDNPVLVLMSQISFAFGQLERDLKFYRDASDRAETRRLQLAMCDALLANDEAAARALARDRLTLLGTWLA